MVVHDGMFNTNASLAIAINPVADSDPVINPDGNPNMTENMGPVPIVYNITDNDQLNDHQLIEQVTITLNNPIMDEVNICWICAVLHVHI